MRIRFIKLTIFVFIIFVSLTSQSFIKVSAQTGKLLVTVKNADGSPCLGQRTRVYEQGQDSTGQPTLITTYTSGDGSTNSQGIVEFDLTPGIYGIYMSGSEMMNGQLPVPLHRSKPRNNIFLN